MEYVCMNIHRYIYMYVCVHEYTYIHTYIWLTYALTSVSLIDSCITRIVLESLPESRMVWPCCTCCCDDSSTAHPLLIFSWIISSWSCGFVPSFRSTSWCRVGLDACVILCVSSSCMWSWYCIFVCSISWFLGPLCECASVEVWDSCTVCCSMSVATCCIVSLVLLCSVGCSECCGVCCRLISVVCIDAHSVAIWVASESWAEPLCVYVACVCVGCVHLWMCVYMGIFVCMHVCMHN